jgi:hypothetical protein
VRTILFVVAAIVAYGAYTLGAPRPLPEARGADCVAWPDYGSQHREFVRETALDMVREMQRRRQLIYGFGNRFAGKWYGLQWNAVNAANYFLGASIAEPEFTVAHKAHAGNAVNESFLVGYVATALRLNRCDAQRLIPQAGADSFAEASAKLDILAAKLSVGSNW